MSFSESAAKKYQIAALQHTQRAVQLEHKVRLFSQLAGALNFLSPAGAKVVADYAHSLACEAMNDRKASLGAVLFAMRSWPTLEFEQPTEFVQKVEFSMSRVWCLLPRDILVAVEKAMAEEKVKPPTEDQILQELVNAFIELGLPTHLARPAATTAPTVVQHTVDMPTYLPRPTVVQHTVDMPTYLPRPTAAVATAPVVVRQMATESPIKTNAFWPAKRARNFVRLVLPDARKQKYSAHIRLLAAAVDKTPDQLLKTNPLAVAKQLRIDDHTVSRLLSKQDYARLKSKQDYANLLACFPA